MLKQLLTGSSVLALLFFGGFWAQAKPQVSTLQAQTQEVPTPNTPTVPPEGTTTPDTTTPPDAGTSPEGTTTPDTTAPSVTPESTPETSPDATTSPDASGTTPESQSSTAGGTSQGIACESRQLPEPTGGGSREFRECQ